MYQVHYITDDATQPGPFTIINIGRSGRTLDARLGGFETLEDAEAALEARATFTGFPRENYKLFKVETNFTYTEVTDPPNLSGTLIVYVGRRTGKVRVKHVPLDQPYIPALDRAAAYAKDGEVKVIDL